MNEYKRKALENAGVNIDEVRERFMGDELFIDKCFKMFINDKTLVKLKEAVLNNNSNEAFIAAHTLKGVCGELSIYKLGSIVCQMSYMLKAGDIKSASEIMPEALYEYEILSKVFNSCFPLAE
ncbi:MAG: hypothetical protein HFH68_06545 [Lachnospiraceae bacterium]|nr:hypothetical protein [Lachnospiraceae bacterium]